jgi:hypothetical protein
MEELIALSSIITRQKIKQIKIISENSDMTGKSYQLYKAIADQKVMSDKDAIALLGYKNVKSVAYQKLKQRLLQRLINTVFFIDINQYSKSTYEKVLHRCYRNWAAAKLVFDRLQRKTAIVLFESVLRAAIEYDITDLILLISKDLRRHYATFEINPKKTDYLDSLIEQNIQYTQQEIHVEKVYSELFKLLFKATPKSDIIQKFAHEIEKIKENIPKNDRYWFNFFAYNSIYFYHYFLKENDQLEIYSKKAISFFKMKNGFSPIALFSFSQKLGVSYLHSNQIFNAKEVFYESLNMGPTAGSINWYNIHSYIFLTHLVLKEYAQAYSIIINTSTHPKFNRLNESYKEPWLIKEAYVHFLIRMGKIEISNEDGKSLRPFRLGRFLNEVPNFSKDKRGLNIAILIVQMLFLILDKKYSKVIDRIDALKQYSYRYLRKNETFRANCFIKMLLKVPEVDYHPVAVKRHTAELHKKLLDSSMNLSESSPETEIIPYENLWEIVMEVIGDR